MTSVKDTLIEAYNNKSFSRVLRELYWENIDNEDFYKEIVFLQNSYLIDIFSLSNEVSNSETNDLYYIEDILEKIASNLQIKSQDLMQFVDFFYEKFESGRILTAFINYCKSDLMKFEKAFEIVSCDYYKWKSLVSSIFLSGVYYDLEKYLDIALELIFSQNEEIAKILISAFGNIDYCENEKAISKVVKTLKEIQNTSTEENILSEILYSSYYIYKKTSLNETKKTLEKIIDELIETKNKKVLYMLARVVNWDTNSLNLMSKAILVFQYIPKEDLNTLSFVDSYLVKLMKQNNYKDVLWFLGNYIVKTRTSILTFDRTVYNILNRNREFLNKIVTVWLCSNEVLLGKAVLEIMSNSTEEIELSIDNDEIEIINTIKRISNYQAFTKKSIGWLSHKNISCMSFLISMFELINVEEMDKIENIIFDSFLLNYPNTNMEYLKNKYEKIDTSKNNTKMLLKNLIKKIEEYLETFDLIENINELKTPQSHREIFEQVQAENFKKDFKTASKNSLTNLLGIKKSVLLFGNSSVQYIDSEEEETQRMEIPLNSFKHEMEIPQLMYISPHTTNRNLTIFRLARIDEEDL